MKSFYSLLGVPAKATDQEIKSAWRKLSKKFHPDKNDGDKFFEDYFKQVNEAYDVLSDPSRRQKYDIFLRQIASAYRNSGSQQSKQQPGNQQSETTREKQTGNQDYSRSNEPKSEPQNESRNESKNESQPTNEPFRNPTKEKPNDALALGFILFVVMVLMFFIFTINGN